MDEKPPYPAIEKMVAVVTEWITAEKRNFERRYSMVIGAQLWCPRCDGADPGMQFQRGIRRCLYFPCKFEFPDDFSVASPAELKEEFKKRAREKEPQPFMQLVTEVLIRAEVSLSTDCFW